jgi:predicted heme/steroid binding protein
MAKNKDGYRLFALDEIRNYDGKDGKRCLIFKDKVHSLSKCKLWANGKHMRLHVFDEKLEEKIKKPPHAEKVLSRFQRTRTMVKKAGIAFEEGRIIK